MTLRWCVCCFLRYIYDHLMLMLNLSCVFVPLFVCWVHTFRLGSFSVVMFVLFRNWMFNIRVCGMQSYFKFCYWFQSIKPENSSWCLISCKINKRCNCNDVRSFFFVGIAVVQSPSFIIHLIQFGQCYWLLTYCITDNIIVIYRCFIILYSASCDTIRGPRCDSLFVPA